jgi:hypothetical protein
MTDIGPFNSFKPFQGFFDLGLSTHSCHALDIELNLLVAILGCHEIYLLGAVNFLCIGLS